MKIEWDPILGTKIFTGFKEFPSKNFFANSPIKGKKIGKKKFSTKKKDFPKKIF